MSDLRRRDGRRPRRTRRVLGSLAAVSVLVALLLCWRLPVRKALRRRTAVPQDPSLVLVTGYCNCGECCSWERSWFGMGAPVHAAGPQKGKPKAVGVTASGTTATNGTIAADVKVYPFGTRLFVPGYGTGTVEDVGGSIRGRHVDIWFPTHEQARRWGARWLKVRKVPQ